jgi:hypothetical protein
MWGDVGWFWYSQTFPEDHQVTDSLVRSFGNLQGTSTATPWCFISGSGSPEDKKAR